MTGGLLNLVSHAQDSVILYGNPQKTFYKATYKQHTNFGLQKFRIDSDNNSSRIMRMNEETKLIFKIPRYADLFYETFLIVNLPDIWSPLYFNEEANEGEGEWTEFGFKWIKELGTSMIKDIEIHSGGNTLARYDGEYFSCIMQRDGNTGKKQLWNTMTGNIAELNDPANAFNRLNVYPNAYFHGSTNIRPSILGRKLYIPIDAWFTLMSKTAFPLVSLQYQELHISITLRPLRELYIIRDVTDFENNYPYIAPNTNINLQQLYRFTNPPEDSSGNVLSTNIYRWNADIHLMSTYIFLDNAERKHFAQKPQQYLLKDVYTWDFPNTTGSKVVSLESLGLVSTYMFRFRRSDVFMRNEWSNYTNWPYDLPPFGLENLPFPPFYDSPDPAFFTTGDYIASTETANYKNILQSMAITLDGKYRENMLDQGIYNYIEKYNKTAGNAKEGLYVYNFCLNSNNREYQPNGAMNMHKFNNINFEIQTLQPPVDPSASFVQLCDADGNVIGTRQNIWTLNEYNYDFRVYEERYNVIVFKNGTCGLMYAR
jgi:hypothetical protein